MHTSDHSTILPPIDTTVKRGPLGPGLIVRAPAPLADAFRDALVKLDSCDVPPLRARLALLAAGRFEHTRAAIRAAHVMDIDLPVLAGRFSMWTGDLRTLAGEWPKVRAALEHVIETGSAAQRVAACTELERLATDLGDPQLSARLTGIARRERAAAAASADETNVQAADAAGVGTSHDTVDAAAATVLECVHHVIGAEPDASRHRLRLRPRILDARELAFDSLRFGDGSVSLAAVRDGEWVRIDIDQDAGAVPITVLLEPVVAGAVQGAEVDGVTASLDARPHDGGTIVPVQLVLDAPRVLTLRLR